MQDPPLLTTAPGGPDQRTVAYFYDDDVGAYAFNLVHPMKPHRIRMAHNLITNYGLDKHMDVLRPDRCTPHEMTRFHTDEYIDCLARVSPETLDEITGHGQRFLIGEDCPAFEGLFEFCSISAGGSLSAARRLLDAKADIAVHWAGGLHHAKKREASGFCYINDIVLSILELLRYHARVLYIDIDVHHGDGVEEAFYTTDRVLTASFHKFGDFFPGTGAEGDKGKGRGKGYAVNFPLKDGIDDESYRSVFRPVLQHIMEWYRPGAVVLQCGADSLAGDKLGSFNLSMSGHASCVAFMRTFNVPLIILGGGGYTIRNVARTWAFETGLACGVEMGRDLPFNEYLEYFGPEFKLDVPRNNMDNANSREYLDNTTASILEGLRNLPFAPSCPLQPVGVDLPSATRTRKSGAHPEDEDDLNNSDADSDLDVRLSARIRATARTTTTTAGTAGAAHLEATYDSEDEDPESLARRKRRFGRNYLSRDAQRRTDDRRERMRRAAAAAAAEEEMCREAGAYGGLSGVEYPEYEGGPEEGEEMDGDGEENDNDGDGDELRGLGAGLTSRPPPPLHHHHHHHGHRKRRTTAKRTFFRTPSSSTSASASSPSPSSLWLWGPDPTLLRRTLGYSSAAAGDGLGGPGPAARSTVQTWEEIAGFSRGGGGGR